MKHLLLLVSLFFFITVSQAQDATSVKGIVISSSTNEVLDRVNIVNLNQVIELQPMMMVSLKYVQKLTIHFTFLI